MPGRQGAKPENVIEELHDVYVRAMLDEEQLTPWEAHDVIGVRSVTRGAEAAIDFCFDAAGAACYGLKLLFDEEPDDVIEVLCVPFCFDEDDAELAPSSFVLHADGDMLLAPEDLAVGFAEPMQDQLLDELHHQGFQITPSGFNVKFGMWSNLLSWGSAREHRDLTVFPGRNTDGVRAALAQGVPVADILAGS